MRDPGYEVLNWAGQKLGADLWFPDLVCAAIFSWGLVQLARSQPRPWLVIALAMPYLVTVVAIGYTRQAAAIGFLMAVFALVARGSGLLRPLIYIAAATVFHRTALIALPLVSLALGRSRLWTFAASIPALYGLYTTFLAPSLNFLVYGYIDQDYASQGAGIRVALVVLGAVVYLLFRKRLGFAGPEAALWLYLSIAAFVCLGLLFALSSSTAVDRLALYLLPMQIVVLARVPGTLMSEGLGKALLVAYAAAVQIVWLTGGIHAQYWIPYRNYIGESYRGTVEGAP